MSYIYRDNSSNIILDASNGLATGNVIYFKTKSLNKIVITDSSCTFLNNIDISSNNLVNVNSINFKNGFNIPSIQNASSNNTLYYDSSSGLIVYEGNPIIESFNFSTYGQSLKLNSLSYNNSQILKTSNISVSLDNPSDFGQIFTFGPSVQDRYLAIGNVTTPSTLSSITFSSDGLTWYTCFQYGTSTGYKIAYNGFIYIAALSASSAALFYSYDNISWNVISGSQLANYCVVWGKDKFIVGTNAGMFYSYDGLTWIATNHPFGTSNCACYNIAFNGSRWVAVGTNAVLSTNPSVTIAYSANGITWTASANAFGTTAGVSRGSGIAWNGIRWVAVGTNASTSTTTVCYSNDNGFLWSTASGTTFNGVGGYGKDIAWNGTRFVAVGTNASTTPTVNAITSVDGINWVATTTLIGGNANSAYGSTVLWNGTKWFAGCSSISPNSSNLYYSNDGLIWNLVTTSPFNTSGGVVNGLLFNYNRPHTITFPRNILVAGGNYSSNVSGLQTTLTYSLDNGLNWFACQNNIFGTNASTSICYSIATNGKIWVAGGSGNTTLGYSFDGIVWSATLNSTAIFSTNVKGIAWSPVLKIWVAVGTGNNQLAYSYDGITWVGVTLPSGGFTSQLGFDVAWGKDKFVACGGAANTNTQKFYYSYDGKNWNLVTGTTFLFGAYAVGFNGIMWVAVGYGNGSTAYSYDGITWIIGSGATFSNNDFTGNGAVAWNGIRWVVTSGTNNATATTTPILYSSDGITWTAAASPANIAGCGMVWNGVRFIAGVSQPTVTQQIYTSNDGISWTAATTNAFGNTCNCVAWSINQPNNYQQLTNVAIQQPLIACGYGRNTLAYSLDGINWKGLGTSVFSSLCNCSCWNGKLWVAGGTGGAGPVGILAYSYNGINWNIANQNILNTNIYQIVWNGTLFVAVGNGTTYSIAYSYDGITWLAPTQTKASLGMSIVYCVAWGQQYFVAGGSGGGAINNIAYSLDGINWTAYVLGLSTTRILAVICGDSTWVIAGQSSTSNPTAYYTTSAPTSSGIWTLSFGVPSATAGQVLCLSYGIYPFNSTTGGTIYSTIFVLGGGGPAAPNGTSVMAYSTDGGQNWSPSTTGVAIFGSGSSASSISAVNSITWTGKRFIAVGGANSSISVTGSSKIAYSNDGQNWYAIPTAGVIQAASLFTSSIFNVSTNPSITLGSVNIDNAVTIGSSSGINTFNQLDIYSDTYFNNGYNNMTITVKSTQLP